MKSLLVKGGIKMDGVTHKPRIRQLTFEALDKDKGKSLTLREIHKEVSQTTPASKSVVSDCVSDLMRLGWVDKKMDNQMSVRYRLLPPNERKPISTK